MSPVVFSTVHDLPCQFVLSCELWLPQFQLPSLLIFTGHCLGWISALVTIIISSLLALLIFGDYCFGCLFCQFIPQPSPPIILNHHLPLGITLRMQVSALKFLQCDGTGWWAFEGLVPAHRVTMESLPAVLCIFTALMAPAPKLIINYWL